MEDHFPVRLSVQLFLNLMLTAKILASRLRVVVNGDSATIMLDIDGPGSLECKLDDEEFQPCECMSLKI